MSENLPGTLSRQSKTSPAAPRRPNAAGPKAREDSFAEFAYITAHNLKEPIRSIGICAGRLQKEPSVIGDPGTSQLVGQILDGVHRMSDLLDDLFAYALIDSLELSPTAVSLDLVVTEALFALNKEIEESHAVVTAAALPVVRGDQMQLTQVMKHLIGNSIKFRTAEPPRVQITAEVQDSQVLVRVEDNGIGIEPAYREKIFSLFKRLHTREKYPGNGVGLAICRGIVERHGGQISVEASAGPGSIFSFTIPAEKRAS